MTFARTGSVGRAQSAPELVARSGEPGVDLPLVALATVGLSVAVGFVAIGPLSDPDAWWNLRAGQYLLSTGRFAAADSWSSFSGNDFVLTEWLGAVMAAALYEPFGAAALVWMRTAGAVAIAVLLLIATRSVADLPGAVIATLVGLLGFSGSMPERPQTLSLAFLVLSVIVWRRAATTGRPTWWLVPLTWLWACTHGYWVLGIAVGAATAVGVALDQGRWRPLLRFGAVLSAMLLAAGLTPVGPRLLLLPARVHSAAAGLVGEWEPATIAQPVVAIVVTTCLAVALSWLWGGWSWWRLAHLMLALCFALTYARLSAPAMALAAPLVAEALQRLRRARPAAVSRPERFALAIGAASVLMVGAAMAPATSKELRHTPVALADELADIPAGAVVLNDYNASSWMQFHFRDLSLVIDSRTEVFSPSYIGRYRAAWEARPGWDTYVRSTGATWAILRSNSPLAGAMQQRMGWARMSAQDGYVLLRSDGAG